MKRHVIETDKVKVIINKGLSFSYKEDVDVSEEDEVLTKASNAVKNFISKEDNDVMFKVVYTDDTDLTEWIDSQKTYKLKLEDIDLCSQLVWAKNCPYAISIESIVML